MSRRMGAVVGLVFFVLASPPISWAEELGRKMIRTSTGVLYEVIIKREGSEYVPYLVDPSTKAERPLPLDGNFGNSPAPGRFFGNQSDLNSYLIDLVEGYNTYRAAELAASNKLRSKAGPELAHVANEREIKRLGCDRPGADESCKKLLERRAVIKRAVADGGTETLKSCEFVSPYDQARTNGPLSVEVSACEGEKAKVCYGLVRCVSSFEADGKNVGGRGVAFTVQAACSPGPKGDCAAVSARKCAQPDPSVTLVSVIPGGTIGGSKGDEGKGTAGGASFSSPPRQEPSP